MSTVFERCDKSVERLAESVMQQYPEHGELIDHEVKIDFVFAVRDDDQPALKLYGVAALAIARKLSLKDRAMGRGDCEIAIDKNRWDAMSLPEQKALLDHELFHFDVQLGKKDDLGRPVLNIRRHDYQFGWFSHIAKRHGAASAEHRQAKLIMENAGACYWPELFQPELPGIKAESRTKPTKAAA